MSSFSDDPRSQAPLDEIRVSVNANASGGETTAVRSFRPESMAWGVAVGEELARQPTESSKADDGTDGEDWHIEEWVVEYHVGRRWTEEYTRGI